MSEFYKKNRPTSLDGVVGQADAIRTVQGLLNRKSNMPHTFMFTGPSGCGKTTLARIMRVLLKCSDMDCAEINAAESRGIDDIRGIQSRMGLAPAGGGRCRVWIVDEAHKLTSDAQNAVLKMLEDTPRHVYFMLCTTDPGKLIKTIITRSTEIKLKLLSTEHLVTIVNNVAVAEGIKVSQKVVDRIALVSEGSARKALVLLNQIAGIETETDQLTAVEAGDAKTAGINIARMLYNRKTTWQEMAKVLKDLEDEPETIRYIVMGYAQAILLNGKQDDRAYLMIDCFRRNFYDSKKSGLVAAAYEVITGK